VPLWQGKNDRGFRLLRFVLTPNPEGIQVKRRSDVRLQIILNPLGEDDKDTLTACRSRVSDRFCLPNFAQQKETVDPKISDQVVGAWKLLSYERVDAASGETTRPWGENPLGYLMYLPGGHMSATLTSEGRKPVPPTDEKQVAQLYFNMSAYAGTYTVQGSTLVHHVKVAWVPSWVGSDQPRQA
jgi:hypothetical protein